MVLIWHVSTHIQESIIRQIKHQIKIIIQMTLCYFTPSIHTVEKIKFTNIIRER